MAEIYGIDETFAMNAEIEELESERQTLIGIYLDSSGSMDCYESVMLKALKNVKSAFQNSKECDEMLVSITTFSSTIAPGGYQLVEDMREDYQAYGCTKLYDCIVEGQKRLMDGNGGGYMEKLQANGVKAKAMIAIFSDGKDNDSNSTLNDARHAIEFYHSREIPVFFIEFGAEAHGIATKLGIKEENILASDATESALRKAFMFVSKSAISYSKSAGAITSMGSNAFEV